MRGFITRARRFKQGFGGGSGRPGSSRPVRFMRCVKHRPALARTHVLAQRLANGLAKFGEVLIDPSTVEATIVRFRLAGISPAALVDARHERGVWMQRPAPTEFAPCSTSTSAHMMSTLR
jgi:threonine aldolase